MAYDLLTVTRALDGRFFNTLEADPSPDWFDMIATTVDTTQGKETFGWFGATPRMELWEGQRKVTGLKEFQYTLETQDYANGIEINEKDLRRQQFGQFDMRVDELADEANLDPSFRLSSRIEENGLAYDGQNMFDTDHDESGTSQSNVHTASGTGAPADPNTDEFSKAIFKAVERLRGFKDDQGRPINGTMRKLLVMVPTNMEGVSSSAANDQIIAQGSTMRTNTLRTQSSFSWSSRVNPWLTDDDVAYVFRTDGRVKPFIMLDEVPPRTSLVDERAMKKRVIYGADRAYRIGYGFWQHAIKIQFAA